MIDMPVIKRKLRIFPIPKYLKTKNIISPTDAINPRRLFAKTRDKVNNIAKKLKIKNSKIAPKVSGSTK